MYGVPQRALSSSINFVFVLERDAEQRGEVGAGSKRLLMLLISAGC